MASDLSRALSAAQESIERKRADMRARFPVTADIVDELRALGLSPRVVWAKEGGNEVGVPTRGGVVPAVQILRTKKNPPRREPKGV